MNIPGPQDLVLQANQLPLAVYLVLLFLSGMALILIRDWRVAISALLVEYLVLGMMLAQLVDPELAFAKVLVGLFICPMLYLSARQAGWRENLTLFSHGLRALIGRRTLIEQTFPPGHLFRLMLVLLLVVIAFALGQGYPLPELPFSAAVAVYWLVLAGLLILNITSDPFKAGQGLLTLLIGFELWYTTLNDSLLLAGLWGGVNIVLALVIGYLTTAHGVVPEEEL